MTPALIDEPTLAALLERAAEMGAQKALAGIRVTGEWSQKEVASYLGVSPRTVTRMVGRRELPPPLSGRWDAAEIRRWRADRRDPSG